MSVGVGLLFDACVVRFDAQAALKAVGRRLSRTPHSTRPWTEWEPIGFDTLDGFNDDILTQAVLFTFHGKFPTPDTADTWLEEMTDAFDDFFGLAVTGFTTSGVNRLGSDDGPRIVDAKFEASAEYEFILHRDTLKPAVRGA